MFAGPLYLKIVWGGKQLACDSGEWAWRIIQYVDKLFVLQWIELPEINTE